MDRPRAPDDPPLGAEEFAACLAPVLATASGIVLAVSGGPNSICMMHMTALLAQSRALPAIVVATVDHGLRAGSQADAAFVVEQAQALGLPVQCLTWEGPKPVKAVQEAAREARYGLLTRLCADLGGSHLLTAHTLDDQAETVLFRLMRGSGPAGLAGMRPITTRNGIAHARPLLTVRKSRLIAACAAHGWPFVTDPSNADPRFARTGLRRLLPMLEAEKLDAPALARLALRAQRADEALRLAAEQLRREASRPCEAARRRFDARLLAGAPIELVIRVLAATVEHLGSERLLRLDAVERAAGAFQDAASRGRPLTRTLHGTVLRLGRDGTLDIAAEGIRRRGRSAEGAAGDPPL